MKHQAKPASERPSGTNRISIRDELDRNRTLLAAPDQFDCSGRSDRLLMLGLGPDPQVAASLAEGMAVRYLECPDFIDQMGPEWTGKIPAHWEQLTPESLSDELIRTHALCIFRQAPRLFSSFWNAILARINLVRRGVPDVTCSETIFLTGAEHSLLTPEIGHAFDQIGFTVLQLPDATDVEQLITHLATCRPALYLSINFKGLDAYGRVASVLQGAGVPIAVWCVDNPFHLLTRLKSPYWRRVTLFVTDDWFIPRLISHGAQSVHHLPLAASPECFASSNVKQWSGLGDRAVFVGRSAFPDKDRFFAAARVSPIDLEAGMSLVQTTQRPDFAWWVERLRIDSLWPGNTVRRAGFGAETVSQQQRMHCLAAACTAHPLTVFGDSRWEELLPAPVDCRPPVDYYGPLADIYAAARYTLNVTSLLLPRGLTQRHFDVWSAGGFLVSDATPGLDLFPEDLVAPIRFFRPDDIPDLLTRLEKEHRMRQELTRAWRDLIHAHHTYGHRLQRMLNIMELKETPAVHPTA